MNTRRHADRLMVAVFTLVVVAGVLAAVTGGSGRRFRSGDADGELRGIRSITRGAVDEAGIELREASWFERLADSVVRCDLCPRLCRIGPGERGYCKVRVNFDGTLYTMVYGQVAAIHNDPIEKKPLFHFLPGERALSVATAGCTLGCTFCQNWTLSQSYPEDLEHMALSPSEVAETAIARGCSTIAYTYNEPSVFFEYMLDCAREAHKQGIRNLWITSGFINPDPLRELCQYLDAANVDLKGIRDEFYQEYCDGHLAPVETAIRILVEEGVHVEITNLLIPGANDSDADIRDLCRWLHSNVGADTVLHFSRYFPAYRMDTPPPTPEATLLRAREIAYEEGLHYVYLGNLAGEGYDDTRCPSCGALLVRRSGYVVDRSDFHIVDGTCAFCGEPIYGTWQ